MCHMGEQIITRHLIEMLVVNHLMKTYFNISIMCDRKLRELNYDCTFILYGMVYSCHLYIMKAEMKGIKWKIAMEQTLWL